MHIAKIKQAAILLGGTVAARRSSLLVKLMFCNPARFAPLLSMTTFSG
ncbi:hypothetical protein [Rhizobium indigoferae]|uniref:Uncharacterized protein n=1 Tax=Rhizobium indigoferae TaxID=158891 RepID=A0ABZ1DPL4_9HYPH|nr:hypothetical protein [Rhizobium indigoferae]NNU57198.1 hypothetical protein [Rhizobium indigoferae]WRW37744.1 hypothetical protein U5G49_007374 [Rhizobium indigoferae]GLR60419.1 hypothetical protein GCM10007919_51480 [Rhizobium indigoferae]